MAVQNLQNAVLCSPECEPNPSLLPHRRSNSGATTLLGSSEHSHPTEPLLQYGDSSDLDLSSHQAPHSRVPRPQWTASLAQDGGDGFSVREGRYLREHRVRRQLRRLRWYKRLLEAVIAAFSVYNTVRYFLAFTLYESTEGQATSLALGICTGAVFALTVCDVALQLFQPHLLVHHVNLLLLLRTATFFRSATSFFLLTPAVVNTALLFVWKNSPVLELNIRRRCHVDIDVIWSVSSTECKPPAWAIWIALTFLRLVITVVIIILYNWVSVMYINIRRPSLTRRSGHERSVASQPYLSTQLPSMTGISPPSFVTPQQNPHLPYHASSESTLRSIARSKQSSNHLSSPSAAAPSVYSDEGTELNHQQPIVNTNPDNFEVALDDYHEHFRNLVSQITRETEDALEPAVNEASSTNVGPPPSTDFYLSRIPPTIGYDEFGRPYPADEHVPILNGYVRRMPTIESMGSRELGSMAPSVLSHSDTAMTASIRSSLPISRPPTRANTLESHFGSRPSSRTNSIAAGAELLLGVGKTSEVGELLDRSAGTASSGSSYPSTYYTATSNGSITSAHPSPTPGS